MKFCSKCGKEIEDFAKFCWACGNAVDSLDTTEKTQQDAPDLPPENKDTDPYESTSYRLGVGLILIGVIAGFIAFIFIGGEGQNFGYPDSWSYRHQGGRETGIWIAVLAGVSLIIGLFLKSSSNPKD